MQCVAWIEPWQNQLYCETTPFYTGIGEKKRRTFFLMYTQIAFVTSAEVNPGPSLAKESEKPGFQIFRVYSRGPTTLRHLLLCPLLFVAAPQRGPQCAASPSCRRSPPGPATASSARRCPCPPSSWPPRSSRQPPSSPCWPGAIEDLQDCSENHKSRSQDFTRMDARSDKFTIPQSSAIQSCSINAPRSRASSSSSAPWSSSQPCARPEDVSRDTKR